MFAEAVKPALSESKRLAATLRRAILEGHFAPNEPFPSLRKLARQHGAGVRVARSATDLLVREGLLYRRSRLGTFVRHAVPAAASDAQSNLRCVTILESPAGILPAFVRMDYLQGHTQALDAHPVRMRVMNLPDRLNRLEAVFSDRYPFPEQGCILVNIVSASVFNWLREHAIPFVVQNYTQYPKQGLPPHHSVAVNKMGGAFDATRRLIELGHRRIGFAGNLRDDARTINAIYEGYVAALHYAGLEARPRDWLPFRTDDPAPAHLLALPFMKDRDLPTAIVAQTDSTAIGILGACNTLGLRVPEDLSVVGVNDQSAAGACDPPLTTVAVPRVQLGRSAIETLLETAGNPKQEPVSKVLTCYLVERESTGAMNAGKKKEADLAGGN